MFSVSVELLHGIFRGDAQGTANTGRGAIPEWPPAPFRLFAAFVAADGTGDRCAVTDGSELEWFERLPPPVIHADLDPWLEELQPRYVVEHRGNAVKSTHQEYVGRKATLVRPGVRVAPKDPRLVYSWKVERPPERTLDALRLRAARIGYLGASDSPVRVHIRAGDPPPDPPGSAFIPDVEGSLAINVPAPGDLGVLDRMYEAWVEHGADIARSQFPALRHEAAYRHPSLGSPAANGEVVAWLRLWPSVSGRRIGPVTALFKEAVLGQYERIFGAPPPVLHGHGFTGKGYELARFLALPDVAFRRSRGRIHGLALWMPPGSTPAESRQARGAAFSVRRLVSDDLEVSIEPREENRPVAIQPRRWEGPSRGWATAFPAIHERRRPLDLAEITRWCRHAGLPDPVAYRATRTPLVRGAADLAPVEVNRPGRSGLPYCHVAILFAEPVEGPVVIGSGRQRGFGLCAPLTDPEAVENR